MSIGPDEPRIMLHDTPLRKRHRDFVATLADRAAPGTAHRPGAARGERGEIDEIEYLPYGPAEHGSGPSCEIVSSYGPPAQAVSTEYAALRRGAGVVDLPSRGVVRIGGADRRAFLNRMLTQELRDLETGVARESFWLNRKGRIQADLLLVETGEAILADLDVHQAAATVESLRTYLFGEDVTVDDAGDTLYRLAVHGRSAARLLGGAGGGAAMPEPLHGAVHEIAGQRTVIVRRDQVGEPGYELMVPRHGIEAVWDALLAERDLLDGAARARPVGWQAFNIARIEAGTPLFNIDFDTTTLPHESGVLASRVSFRKGCYLGQEIVARMESLGKPKQRLVGLRLRSDALPVSGAALHAAAADGSLGDAVGVVTSSTLSPMLGAVPIAFAMVRSTHADDGTVLRVGAEGGMVDAVVGPLAAWSGGAARGGEEPAAARPAP